MFDGHMSFDNLSVYECCIRLASMYCRVDTAEGTSRRRREFPGRALISCSNTGFSLLSRKEEYFEGDSLSLGHSRGARVWR
jgi:hypothetical protein